MHRSKSPGLVGLVYGGHLVHRYGCLAYPEAPHEEVELICDKCGRAWQVQMRLLRLAIEVQRLRKVAVADISRRAIALGPPSTPRM